MIGCMYEVETLQFDGMFFVPEEVLDRINDLLPFDKELVPFVKQP